MAAISNTLRRQRIEELEAASLARLARILDKGSDKDALEAAKMVLNRTMPEPKVNTAEVARLAAMGAAAGANGGMGAIAAKAAARLDAPDKAQTIDATFTDAERAPLFDVSTPGKGGNK